jgi:hypothetical protein
MGGIRKKGPSFQKKERALTEEELVDNEQREQRLRDERYDFYGTSDGR